MGNAPTPKPDDSLFSATMRIELPHELTQEDEAGRKAGGKKIIRIPRSGGRTLTGTPDFQALLQNIYDAVLITDPNGQIANVNTRAIQFFGFDADELTSINILQIISGATEELLTTISRTLQSDRFVLIQACCNRKDGSFFPAEISVNRLRLSSNDCLSFFVRNVTWRKEAEEQLRTSATAIRSSGSGIAIADTEGALQFCNPAMLKLWSLEEHEILGTNVREFLEEPRDADAMADAVKSGETWSREVVMKNKGGDVFFAQVSVVPNVNPEGTLSGMVLSLLDISSLKNAQAALEDYAEKLLQRNAEMEDDLRMAREVQLASLPREYLCFPRNAAPDRAALAFNHLYHPSGIVGGDFFDIIPISATKAGILIADVTGHGVRAALIVATIRGLIEQLSPSASDPAEFFTKLNQAYTSVFTQTIDMMLATALYLVIDTKTGRTLCCSAGHPSPFRLKRGTRTVEPLHFSKELQGPGFGLYPKQTFRNLEFTVEPGDVLLLYTDGLSDVMNAKREFYDETRMTACLSENLARPPADFLKAIVSDAKSFSGSEDFEDDLCLLAAEVQKLG